MIKKIVLLLFISYNIVGQIPINKKEILIAFSVGENIKKIITEKDVSNIEIEFKDVFKRKQLISLIESEKFSNKDYVLNSDIYFNPKLSKYIYTIFCSKNIKINSEWGLSDYLFVIELQIDYNNIDKKAIIYKKTILDQNSNLKKWWQSLMISYQNPKFLRNRWTKEFNLIPPPPPPAQDKDWFNN